MSEDGDDIFCRLFEVILDGDLWEQDVVREESHSLAHTRSACAWEITRDAAVVV